MMKATSCSRAHRFVLNVAMLLIVLPLFPVLGYACSAAAGPGTWFSDTSPVPAPLKCVVGVVGLLAIVAAVLVLWKGWVKIALCIVGAGYLVLGFWGGGSPAEPESRQIELVIGAHSTVTGVEVYCNGVCLGKTPMRISKTEFREKVPPWSEPPRQERLERGTFPGKEFSLAKYAWVPNDVFEQYEQWPPDDTRYFIDDNDEAVRAFKSSRYWWHFEVTGHQGIAPLGNFAGGASGTNWGLTVTATPQATFPALKPHLELLIDGLRSNEHVPTPSWLAHFRKHQDVLFLPFYERVQEDSRLGPAMEAVVRAELDLPEEPSPEDCDRALGAILDRVEARDGFAVPSLESLAVDLMGEAARGPVVRRFREEASTQPTHHGRAGSGSWEIESRGPRASRQLPLEYAVRRLLPPELFDGLVYGWGSQRRYLEILANYSSEEANRLLSDYLLRLKRKSSSRHVAEGAIRFLAQVHNPQMEVFIRDFVQSHGSGPSARHSVVEFIESRLGAPGIDQDDLGAWIYHFAPLEEREKLKLLARVDAPGTWPRVQLLGATRDQFKRETLIGQLARRPNPSLDQFVIDCYQWYGSKKRPGYWPRSVSDALVGTDTPAIRQFITGRWDNEAERLELLNRVTEAEGSLSRLAWMIPLVEQAADASTRQLATGLLAGIDTPEAWALLHASTRQLATRLLAGIDTPEAWALLQRWAQDDPDEQVRQAAAEQLDLRQAREGETEKRLQQYADLISGKIGPDDLLPSQPAWVWDGQRYVQETAPDGDRAEAGT